MSRARLEELTIALGSYKTSSLALDSLLLFLGQDQKVKVKKLGLIHKRKKEMILVALN
jgi:hypothetical protein